MKISNKNQRKIVPSVKELVSEIIDFLETEKLFEIVCISLKGKSQEADFMVISSGRSSRQVSAVSEKLLEFLKNKHYYVFYF